MNAIDRSVLIHFYDERDPPRRAVATNLIKRLEGGVMLWQVACEFMAASRRLAATGFTPEDARARLDELLHLFPLVLPKPQVLERARALVRNRQMHFWDAMIFAACVEHGIGRLYSADVPGTAIPDLEIVNPFA